MIQMQHWETTQLSQSVTQGYQSGKIILELLHYPENTPLDKLWFYSLKNENEDIISSTNGRVIVPRQMGWPPACAKSCITKQRQLIAIQVLENSTVQQIYQWRTPKQLVEGF
jgi:hypothetical protein